jgi:hypothetical protein
MYRVQRYLLKKQLHTDYFIYHLLMMGFVSAELRVMMPLDTSITFPMAERIGFRNNDTDNC